jgi:ABC-type multidrug transport system ATPase subunit
VTAGTRPDAAFDFDVVRTRDVSRHFGRRRALAHVSVTCRAGEIVGLFGPNGAGKSTLLGILSTLVRPTSGAVDYGDGGAPATTEALRARIGVLGHDLFLYSDLSARENLRFFGQLYGLDEVDARVVEALRAARLEDRADDRVGGFSRGLRQRLALERALLHRPRLVLLDEPFTGLDDASSSMLGERLRSLREAGSVVVMATHDFDSAEGVVDRAICLNNGRARPMAQAGGRLRERYRQALAELPA